MAIIALKAWYIAAYEPLPELEQRPHDLRLNKNSLLKSAMRADFLDDSNTVRQATWFQRYLEGELVEFYIEGSGYYAIANIDLISHEIYFTKQDALSNLDPTIFLCYQTEYGQTSDWLRDSLTTQLDTLNAKSRLPLTLAESHRLTDGPVRLNSTLLRKLRRCLLFVADITAVTAVEGDRPQARLLPSANVCVEVGYALQCKRPEQILLVQRDRPDLPGQFPFDIPGRQRLVYSSASDLQAQLPPLIEVHLQRFNLWH